MTVVLFKKLVPGSGKTGATDRQQPEFNVSNLKLPCHHGQV